MVFFWNTAGFFFGLLRRTHAMYRDCMQFAEIGSGSVILTKSFNNWFSYESSILLLTDAFSTVATAFNQIGFAALRLDEGSNFLHLGRDPRHKYDHLLICLYLWEHKFLTAGATSSGPGELLTKWRHWKHFELVMKTGLTWTQIYYVCLAWSSSASIIYEMFYGYCDPNKASEEELAKSDESLQTIKPFDPHQGLTSTQLRVFLNSRLTPNNETLTNHLRSTWTPFIEYYAIGLHHMRDILIKALSDPLVLEVVHSPTFGDTNDWWDFLPLTNEMVEMKKSDGDFDGEKQLEVLVQFLTKIGGKDSLNNGNVESEIRDILTMDENINDEKIKLIQNDFIKSLTSHSNYETFTSLFSFQKSSDLYNSQTWLSKLFSPKMSFWSRKYLFKLYYKSILDRYWEPILLSTTTMNRIAYCTGEVDIKLWKERFGGLLNELRKAHPLFQILYDPGLVKPISLNPRSR
jgi:hypothetical protein